MLPRLLVLCVTLLAVPAGAQAPLIIGAAMPQTGFLADLAADLRKGLLLWQEEVNAAGGLLGRRVELQLLDDRSEAAAAGKLYEQLLREHKAELLIGPFGSAASLGAAAVAERHRRVLLNATGAARAVHKAGYRYVFQVPAPLGAYGAGALELARRLGLRRIVVLAHEDPTSRESAMRTREHASAQGIAAGEVEAYAHGSSDFAPQVARARAAGAEGWIAFGLARDAVEMVKSFRRLGYAPRLFVTQGAAAADFIAGVGQDAEYAVGISPYERRAATRGNAQFAQAFAKKWSAEPGHLAAEGYAAAKVLEEAVRRAGSFDMEKLRATLAALETETPLGPFRVDRSGAQVAARPLLVQVIRGRRQIVWPEALATAKLQPYPDWEARKPLK
ncbi:MAG: amino acid ABC transporter substrate-binding protein [Betaproteobacteria bacterium]|nr:amino acid ABC transporter substrate-binding protein [Betaproteobacteria bacterium]